MKISQKNNLKKDIIFNIKLAKVEILFNEKKYFEIFLIYRKIWISIFGLMQYYKTKSCCKNNKNERFV